jgi:hypothetical protein
MFGETSTGYLRSRLKEASGPSGQVYGSLGSWPTCLSQNYLRVLADHEVGFE